MNTEITTPKCGVHQVFANLEGILMPYTVKRGETVLAIFRNAEDAMFFAETRIPKEGESYE